MKILHVITSEKQGGAAIAARRLHKELLERKIDSQILVQTSQCDDPKIHSVNPKASKLHATLRRRIDELPWRLLAKTRESTWSVGWLPNFSFKQSLKKIDPDVVHLHWIGRGYIPFSALNSIECPIVWSLHDMAAFTGGCHYSEGCNNFSFGCGKCHLLKRPSASDLSHLSAVRKKRIYDKTNLTLIGVSAWITKLAQESAITKSLTTVNIPNVLDLSIYKVKDRQSCRERLRLPKAPKLILFGADNLSGNKRKGYDLLSKALELLPPPQRKDLHLVTFGELKDDDKENCLRRFGMPVTHLGHITSEQTLSELYSAANLFVQASREDNLPNTILESLHCGTPVAAFDIGGIGDMVKEGFNGSLAKAENAQSLAEAVLRALHITKRDLKPFDQSATIKRYIQLYQHVVKL